MTKESDNDKEPVTPIRVSSGAYPIFQKLAEERSAELESLGTVTALRFRVRCQVLLAVFRSWTIGSAVSEEERKKAIDEMFALNGEIAKYLATRQR